MMVLEARAVARMIAQLNLPEGTVCLNIGSSTRQFREIDQPHNFTDLIAPLQAQGIRFVHCDLKPADGVDIVGDVYDPLVQAEMRSRDAGLLLMCNLLEHLTDPGRFAATCGALVRPGGYVVVSVPYSYPLHRDPIDTLFRPTPDEISALFPGFDVMSKAIIDEETFLQETMRQPRGGVTLVKHLVQVLLPFYRYRKWQERAHRLFWLFRPYRVSVTILRRPLD
jgi:SAM-dependent methyltransferase